MDLKLNSKPQMLWLSSVQPDQSFQMDGLRGLVEICWSTNWRQAQAETEQKFFPVILIELTDHVDEDCWQYLASLRIDLPLTVVMVLVRQPDFNLISLAIHRIKPWRILEGKMSLTDLQGHLSEAFSEHQQILSQKSVLERVKQQNRRLEEMTLNLEGLIRDRTEDLNRSKVETEQNVRKMSRLVHFVNEVNGLMSPEELLLTLLHEAKVFHKLSEVILAVAGGPSEARADLRLIYGRGQRVYVKQGNNMWDPSSRIRVDTKEDSLYLANEFGRPFSKVLAFPIQLDRPGVSAILFFEHSFDGNEVEAFIGFMAQRVQTLSLALDRSLLEQELRRESLIWEQTFDGIEDPVAIIDKNWQLLRANRHFTAELVPGRSCFEHFAGRQAVCLNCPLDQERLSLQAAHSLVKRGDLAYEVYSDPIQLRENRAVAFVNHYVDVSLQQKLQGQMIQNEKMVAIGHLAGHIAHELNNPLTGIQSLSQLMRAELPKDSELAEDLFEVEKAALRSQKIINNLLSFARRQEGGSQECFDLNGLIESTLPFLKTAMTSYRCDIDLAPTALKIRGDSQLLQQVVFNLINNACQAMDGEGRLDIATRVIDSKKPQDSRSWVELKIKDSGPGIPPHLLQTIFEPFFTTKGEGQGTGLGLSLSRDIIGKMGGEIRVESRLGEGAQFSISLPLEERV